MPVRLDASRSQFEEQFRSLLASKREVSEDVDQRVREIIARVRREGDAGLVALTRELDGLASSAAGLRVEAKDIEAAVGSVDGETMAALRLAHDRIATHHQRQRPADFLDTDASGATLGQRWTPVDSVGLYVPGGQASYPSSVLMNAVPARVAGVDRIVMVVPVRDGRLNPLVLAAAHMAGVGEIYRIGGAQAVAALAYGTETIAPVAKIVGPGNAYVAAAKRQVFGQVGIDSIAGPSEVLVIADASVPPDWVAADLLAQAEHDSAAQSILMTDDAAFADAVEAAVERQLSALPRREIAGASWRDNGAVILLGHIGDAVPLADRIAAEHLQIMTPDAVALAGRIRNAGAIFVGPLTPEAIGDYVAGTNHVLPTARSARFSSGLGVLDFMKRTSIVRLDETSLAALGPAASCLARAEDLEGHARSVDLRLPAAAMRRA